MNELNKWDVLEPLRHAFQNLISFIPSLITMLVVVLIGLAIAWLLKRLSLWLFRVVKLEKAAFRTGISTALQKAGITRTTSEALAILIFWVFFLSFLMLGLSGLQITAFDRLAEQFFVLLSNLVIALAIVLFGYLLSVFIRHTVLVAAVNAGLRGARLLSGSVQALILILFLAMALEQLGIGKRIVVAAFSVLMGGVVLALALAFGLGARDIAREFLEGHLGRRQAPPEKQDEISHL